MDMEVDKCGDEDAEIKMKVHVKTDALSDSDPIPSTSDSLTQSCKTRAVGVERSIALNRMAETKLRHLEKVLIGRLRECRQKLAEIQNSDSVIEKEVFTYGLCGRPYFRDKVNVPAPDNIDTTLTNKCHMFDFSSVGRAHGWTVKEKSDFITLIKKITINLKKTELNTKIQQLKQEKKVIKKSVLDEIIETLKKEIGQLSKRPFSEIVLPIDQDYDWDAVATKSNFVHSPTEYEALWKLFLHPSVNKSVWDKAESSALQTIANKHGLQDWNTIAEELNTGRTGYQCFVYFRTNKNNVFSSKRWTSEEEERLKKLIQFHREDNYIPWAKIASHMENRTLVQVYQKYVRLMKEQRKGRFLPEEDAVILNCVDCFGQNFKKMAEYLPGRSCSQIQRRHSIIINNRLSTVWTIDEDRLLIQLMSNQDTLTNFSDLVKHFNGKDRVNLRTRYITLQKFMKKYPNLGIEHAPRRKARMLSRGNAANNLNKAVEKLKSRMQVPTQTACRRKLEITLDSPEKHIEDAIIAALINEDVESTNPGFSEKKIYPTVNIYNLTRILMLLRAKLNIEKFKKSYFSTSYPELVHKNPNIPDIFKIRCYSQNKETSQSNELCFKDTSIWGGKCWGAMNYVLPPNYSTITGCNKLMAYTASHRENPSFRPKTSYNFHRNCIVKDLFSTLVSRFDFLFIWPMLISNEGPNLNKLSYPDCSYSNSSTDEES